MFLFIYDSNKPSLNPNNLNFAQFHIIREEEVSVAVDKLGGDASKVWKRNISLLEEMDQVLGREETERVLKGEAVQGVQEILRRLKSSSGTDHKV